MNIHPTQQPCSSIVRSGGPALAVLAAMLMAACASTPPPTEQLAVSTAALAQAVSAGSGEFAPADLKLARDKLDRANLAMAAKDYPLARSLAQEAQVDARLAQARSGATKAQRAADELQEGRRILREEMDRKAR